MEQAQPIAYLALILVVPATVAAFAMFRPTVAALIILLGSVLFLPERINFDAPLIPPLDKESIPAVCVLIALFVTSKKQLREARPGRGIDWLMIGSIVCIAGTTLTNRDAQRFGDYVTPVYTSGDLLSELVGWILGPLIPFFVGRTLFRSAEDSKALLKAFAIGGIIYLPLVLIEWRLSPQMNGWVYGYWQHSWGQTKRDGGWRPMVFMAHGLALSLFMFASMLSAWTLAKAKIRLFGAPSSIFGIVLTVVLSMLHSLGALIYGLVGAPLSWFLKPKTQLRVAALIALIVALYPILRATDVFPREALVDRAAKFSQERAQSLDFRFKNEDALIVKTLERPLFGWGGYARGHVMDELGNDRSVIDGAWIGILNRYGIAGFIAQFGLLLLPIWAAGRQIGRISAKDQPLLAGVALISAFYTLDLLPNGMFNQFPMLLSGAVMGLAQGMSQEKAGGLDEATARRFLHALRNVMLARSGR